MKNKYKTAIIGCGRIGSLFATDTLRKGVTTHAQAYRYHPQTQLSAACDIDKDRLHQFGKTWAVERLYLDSEEMLQKERPDFVSICVWDKQHENILAQAVKSKVKGIICEKPIAHTLLSAKKMIRSCQTHQIPLIINHRRRYDPMHQRIKQMLESGMIGQIQTVVCMYIAGIANSGTHMLDILRYFFGDVSWVWTSPSCNLLGKDPSFDIYLHFDKGFNCVMMAVDVKQYMQFEIDIYGTQGRIQILDAGEKCVIWEVAKHPSFSEYKTLKPSRTLKSKSHDQWANMISDLIHCVEKKKTPLSSGADGFKSLEIIRAAHLSYQRKKRISLPLK